MKSLFSQKKPLMTVLLGVFVVGAVLFAGCTSSNAKTPSSSSGAAQTQQSDRAISDARNTPAVRAAKAVGPAVVGITNKAVARDWFNNPVETQGVGSGVIFKSDGYIVTNNHVISGAK